MSLLVSRVAVTVVALAGLFAMHGLADHGVASQAVATVHAATAAGTHPGDHGEGHGEGGTSTHGPVELCLALLGLVLLLLLGHGPVAQRRRSLLPPSCPDRARPRARPRAPDPPDPISLCVHRC